MFSVVTTISQSFSLSGRSDRLAFFLFFCVLAVRQHGLSRYPFRAADQSPHGHLGRLLDVATVLPPGIVQQGLRALEASQVI